MADNIATASVADIKTKIETLAEVEEGIYVYDQDQLLEQSIALQTPYIGVVYEGIFSDNSGKASGLAGILRLAIYVVGGGQTIGGQENKNTLTNLMDKIRNVIRLTEGPSKHKWVFVEETLAPFDDAHFAYVQRWSLRVPLTPPC